MADRHDEKRAFDAGYAAGGMKHPKSANPYRDKDADLERMWDRGHDDATAGKPWEPLE